MRFFILSLVFFFFLWYFIESQTLTFLLKYMDGPVNSVSGLETFEGLPSLTFCSRPGINFVQAEKWLLERVDNTKFQDDFVKTGLLTNSTWQLLAFVGSLNLDVRDFIWNMAVPTWAGTLTACQFLIKNKTYNCGFGTQVGVDNASECRVCSR